MDQNNFEYQYKCLNCNGEFKSNSIAEVLILYSDHQCSKPSFYCECLHCHLKYSSKTHFGIIEFLDDHKCQAMENIELMKKDLELEKERNKEIIGNYKSGLIP